MFQVLKKKRLILKLERNRDITITATFKHYIDEIEEEDKNVLISTIKEGECSKKITFKHNVDVDKIAAKFNNGVVLITIPILIIPKNKINVE